MITQEQIQKDKEILEEMYKKYDLRVHELTMSNKSTIKDRLILARLTLALDALETAVIRLKQLPSYETI